MAFKKGHKGFKESKNTEVNETVSPIMDKEVLTAESEDDVIKQETIQRVLRTQAEASTVNSTATPLSNKEYYDEPVNAFGRTGKVRMTVKLVSIVKKYRDKPFMSCPPYSNSKRKYLTGQEDLTADELAKQPLIIDPNAQYPIIHSMTFDPSKPEDKIMLNYYKNILEVAQTKKDIKPGITLFYIENREEEAEQEIGFSKLVFKAMEKINQCSLSRMQDIVLMLSLPGQNLTKLQAENLLWKECQRDPKRVLEQFDQGKEDELFLRKLISSQILFERRGEGIYERLEGGSNMFLGRTIPEAVKFIREARNQDNVVRWGSKLKEKGLR